MKNNKGFTLIELLVVVAIIGILSSVVLASLNTARGKGADAAIKSNLANMRAQAEIYFDNPSGGNGSYGPSTPVDTDCSAGLFGDVTVAAAVNAAVNASGGVAQCAIGDVNTVSSWAISVPLKTAPASSWCVDSRGQSKMVTGATPALGGGPAEAACP